MKRARSLDHTLTERLRSYGKRSLVFWKHVAAHGLWGFALVWMFVVLMGWMAWWQPLVPLLLSYVTLLVVQAIVRRERPNFEKISGYTMWFRTYSFPSGHATESSVLAASLMLLPVYPSLFAMIFFFAVLLFFAGMIMYSRIAIGVHYFGDVLAGCVLGVAYALAFV